MMELIDVSPITLTFKFNDETTLPRTGDTFKNNDCDLMVIESSAKTRIIKAIFINKAPLDHINKTKKSIEEYVESISVYLYQTFSKGMTSLIGWDFLPAGEKEIYLSTAKDIVRMFNKVH